MMILVLIQSELQFCELVGGSIFQLKAYLRPWNVCWYPQLPKKADIKKLQQKLLQLQVTGRTQKPKHHQTTHQDLLKQTASNSLEAVVGLPSSTSLSMGAGRGIFPLWRSG